MHITSSLGAAYYPQDGIKPDILVKNAEVAMYRAKEKGGNHYFCYTLDLQNKLNRKLFLERMLRESIKNHCAGFEAVMQPKAWIQGEAVFGSEALIRWNSPEGLIYPDEFIPLAEETGLIVPISWWMLTEACRLNQKLNHHGFKHTVAVNIPSQVLLHSDFIPRIIETGRITGMSLSRLDIEITEATLVEDLVKVHETVDKLHALGVTVSIDDFGTGYSSLSYLTKITVDRIKIDRSFIFQLGSFADKENPIVNAIIALGKSLNIIVTAEGVETSSHVEYLSRLKCDEIQGYYLSKPLSFPNYLNYLTNHANYASHDEPPIAQP